MSSNLTAKPLVSVVLTVMNCERYIAEQIDSILSQTHANLELIVCDDCSKDRTPDIVQEYARKDPRVRLIRNQQNLNVSLSFQTHCRACRGEFIAPADADDYWLADKLEKQVSYLQSNPQAQLVFADDMISSENLSVRLGSFQRKIGNFSASGPIPLETLLQRNLVPFHISCFRRTLLDQILPMPKQSACMYDYWIALVASLTFPIGYLDECLVLYRQHQNNMVGSGCRNLNFYIRRLSDEKFLRQYLKEKSDFVEICERLLALNGTPSVRKALHDTISNQKALLASLQIESFWRYYSRLLKAGWIILFSSQKKHHLKQLFFLLCSWPGVKRLKTQPLMTA